ncbi:MAG: NUDIX domain-containing protein [Flavobacteriales bacterium TMED96]|nr:MAG: NUDIX domain-containing protein [Flavobacteriales bacterium TMED96]|tara:strand:+ start:1357 stop:1962 length:606 start_codon:yes stop_codon:yes gene_type:complete
MYKVFFNQKLILLTTDIISPREDSPFFYVKFTNKKFVVQMLKSKKVKMLYLYHSKEDKLWYYFLNMFKLIEAAGGLVRNLKTNHFLFIFRNKKWDLPKGRINKNEEVQKAAIREVEEETGVESLSITKPLNTTYHIFKRNRKYRLKKTFWYLMETNYNGELTPEIKEGIEKAIWIDKKLIVSLKSQMYQNINLIISTYINN